MLSTIRWTRLRVKTPIKLVSIKLEVEVLTTPGERRMIRGGKVETHHHEERMQEPLGLTEWQGEEETEPQCGSRSTAAEVAGWTGLEPDLSRLGNYLTACELWSQPIEKLLVI